MAENKWIMDGHHYTCPECKKTMAIVVNESDEGFEFCPFCGKRMSSQMAENKMEQVAAMFGKKLGERFSVKIDNQIYDCSFEKYGFNSYSAYFDAFILQELLTGTAVIINE